VATGATVTGVDEPAPTPEMLEIQPRKDDALVKIERLAPHPAAEPNEVTPAIFRTPATSTKSGPPLSPLQIVEAKDGATQTKLKLYGTL